MHNLLRSVFFALCSFNRFCSRSVSEAKIRSAVFQRCDPGSILAICQTLEVALPSANPTSTFKMWNEKNVSTVFLFLTRTLDPALDVGTVPDPGGVFILYLFWLMHFFSSGWIKYPLLTWRTLCLHTYF